MNSVLNGNSDVAGATGLSATSAGNGAKREVVPVERVEHVDGVLVGLERPPAGLEHHVDEDDVRDHQPEQHDGARRVGAHEVDVLSRRAGRSSATENAKISAPLTAAAGSRL